MINSRLSVKLSKIDIFLNLGKNVPKLTFLEHKKSLIIFGVLDKERHNKVISRVELPRFMYTYCIAIAFYQLPKMKVFAILEIRQEEQF